MNELICNAKMRGISAVDYEPNHKQVIFRKKLNNFPLKSPIP